MPKPGLSSVAPCPAGRRGSLVLLILGACLAAHAADPAASPAPASPRVSRSILLSVPPGGSTGFQSLPAAASGIAFTNRLDVPTLLENYNTMQGSGVALGDFDGDGRCDIYFCAIAGTNALYRNLGNWRFEDVTARANAELGLPRARSTGTTFADLDGDRDLDLLVNTLGQGTHAFENLGDGHFREITVAAGLASTTGATSFALGDIDGDGDLDLYVANYGAQALLRAGGSADVKRVDGKWVISGPHAQRLRLVDGQIEELGEPDVLYRNDGRGHFAPVPWNSEWFLDQDGKPLPAPWDFGLSVQIRDVDGDGDPDIYVCNDFQTVDRFWINDGTGHFRLLSKLAMRQQSFSAMGVDFADLDRDGHLDFLVAEMLGQTHSLRLRQMSSFTPPFPVPGRFDGRSEVVKNTLFWNRGDGTYAEIAHFAGVAATDWSWQPVFLDVDLDGFEDLLVVNGNAYDLQDRDTFRAIQADGRLTPEQTRTNLLRHPRLDTPNVALRNRGNLTFEDASAAWGFDSRRISQGIALADLDQDGDLDAVMNCLQDGPLLLKNGSTRARLAVRLEGRAPNTRGVGARIRLSAPNLPVQQQEIVAGGRYLSADDAMRVFATGNATNGLRLEVTWRDGSTTVVSNALPNSLCVVSEIGPAAIPTPAPAPSTSRGTNNAPTPLFADLSSALRHRHAESPFDEYARQPLLPRQFSTAGPGVAWVDIDGNEWDDLVIGAGRGGRLAVFQGNGKGQFTDLIPTNAPPVPDDMMGLALGALPDGRPAVLAGLSAYENTGLRVAVVGIEHNPQVHQIAVSPARSIPPLKAAVGPLALADLDGDQDLDLFVGARLVPGAYPQPATSRLYRQNNGAWEPDPVNQPRFDRLGLVNAAVWSDLDDDAQPDLVLACEWGPIRIFRNAKGTLTLWNPAVRVASTNPGEPTRDTTLDALTGWWNSIAAGDFDGDGRLDLVAGNWGLNGVDQPTPAQPVVLYHGELGGGGVVDLLETEYAPELRALAPRRSLSALSQAAPKLAALYPTHAAFSTSTVPDLFRGLEVAPAEVRAATLASMVFLNRGDRFDAIPLPREAQFAPVFGIVVADFDGDAREDLFLAQNFFANRPEVPRLDAGQGLLLRGSGDGHFQPVPGSTSGIVVHGEQRGAATADFDGDGRPDLVVAQNAAETRLFRNAAGTPGIRVRLAGPVGNPFAIGAKLRLFANRKPVGPLRELHAGSGYLSQDSPTTVLAVPPGDAVLEVTWPGGQKKRYLVPAGFRSFVLDHRSAGNAPD